MGKKNLPVPRISHDIEYKEVPCLVLSKLLPNLSLNSAHWDFCGLGKGDEAPCWPSIGHFDVCRALSLKDGRQSSAVCNCHVCIIPWKHKVEKYNKKKLVSDLRAHEKKTNRFRLFPFSQKKKKKSPLVFKLSYKGGSKSIYQQL